VVTTKTKRTRTRAARLPSARGATRADLLRVYRRLRRRFGHARWWPGETPFEVCVGAILTQNTAWTNVERALDVLRRRGLLAPEPLARLRADEIAPLVRSAGTYNVKARRLAAFVAFLAREFGGRVEAMAEAEPGALRARLLAVDGIGPETADAILLYAAGLPVFVVDAYTRRVFARLGLVGERAGYDEVQRFFSERLPRDAALFNDYHAQIVRLAKDACRTRPLCERCPLDDLCPRRGIAAERAPARRPPRRES
jgi:endonuclease-3 related protein